MGRHRAALGPVIGRHPEPHKAGLQRVAELWCGPSSSGVRAGGGYVTEQFSGGSACGCAVLRAVIGWCPGRWLGGAAGLLSGAAQRVAGERPKSSSGRALHVSGQRPGHRRVAFGQVVPLSCRPSKLQSVVGRCAGSELGGSPARNRVVSRPGGSVVPPTRHSAGAPPCDRAVARLKSSRLPARDRAVRRLSERAEPAPAGRRSPRARISAPTSAGPAHPRSRPRNKRPNTLGRSDARTLGRSDARTRLCGGIEHRYGHPAHPRRPEDGAATTYGAAGRLGRSPRRPVAEATGLRPAGVIRAFRRPPAATETCAGTRTT
ncbi:hypothetical protein CryarDRAFT_2094 [Cryptosporangium arvum DSM 44712]|uniref:Uncharacterized protein n=1 Tax=Cryptosporangium arvum DSM 44712 TaxID=927661 RepID=A0A010ZQP8_9ACTN|nr:hypothetical protein CryarDRAFT_2094 [Cryptosporangium arvum DSM 44712]